jgi:ATP-binding cassette subfamily B protein
VLFRSCGFQMLVGFVFAAYLAIHGEISIGTYPAYVGLVVWLIWPMRNLGRLIVQTSTGLVSFGRVQEIIKQDREPLEDGDYQPQGELRGEILFQDVCFEYRCNGKSRLRGQMAAKNAAQAISPLFKESFSKPGMRGKSL